MDFPDNVIVNAHKIDGIHGIRWTQYSLVDSNASDSAKQTAAGSCATSNYRLKNGQLERLRILESELRSNEFHVSCNVDELVVWVFELLGSDMEVTRSRTSTDILLHTVTRLDMRRLFFGFLKASDMHDKMEPDISALKSAKTATTTQSDIEKANAQAIAFNTVSNNQSDIYDSPKSKNLPNVSSKTFSIATIIANMSEAISMSIVYSLARIERFSPISNRSCIASHFSGGSTNEIWQDQSKLGGSLTSTLARWSSSGTLTILVSQTLIQGLQRVSDILNKDVGNIELTPASKVLVSPSGRVVRYHKELGNSTDFTNLASSYSQDKLNQLKDIKNQIIKQLALLGLRISHDEKWLKLKNDVDIFTANNNTESELTVFPRLRSFLWPAKLCFCKVEPSYWEGQPVHRNFNQRAADNPLAYAESWFKLKSSREEAIQTQRKEVELKTQRLREGHDMEIEGILTAFTPRVTQYLSTQDTSGIYPTPPDVLRSQAIGLATNAETHVVAVEFGDKEAVVSANSDMQLTRSPFAIVLDTKITSTRYEEPDDADLFGEMDSGLFAANGLTEADFSFFDEPSIGDELNLSLSGALGGGLAKDVTAEPDQESNLSEIKPISLDNPALEDISSGKEDDLRPDGNALVDQPEPLRYLDLEDSLREDILTPVIDSDGHAQFLKEKSERGFGSVNFREKIESFNGKYEAQGRFGYELEAVAVSPRPREQQSLIERSVPRVGLANEEDAESYEADGTHSDQVSNGSVDVLPVGLTNPSHEDTKSDIVSGEETPNLRKRKRESMNSEHPNTPQSKISTPSDNNVDGETIFPPMMGLFSVESNALLDHFPNTITQVLGGSVVYNCGQDRAFMQVAQILVDQLILRTDISRDELQFPEASNHHFLGQENRDDQVVLRDIIGKLFLSSEQCNLIQYANLEREPPEPTSFSRLLQKEKTLLPKPKSLRNSRVGLAKLKATYTCVRRNQVAMDVLASALPFWEELGFGPAHESKDVTAVYIFPASSNVQYGVETFSKMIGYSYQSCKLGTYIDASNLVGYSNGLVPITMDTDDDMRAVEELKRVCEKLGANIANLQAQGGNTVIYMINPFEESESLFHFCAAFLKLFESYVSALKFLQVDNPNDLVLQVIPKSFVALANTIALPSPARYRKLAFEVYDRCPPSAQAGDLGFFRAPSIRLAREIPKTVNLKLSPEPTAGLLSSDMCFHLAYSWDLTQQWLTASWTDNQGDLQWYAPYCLGVEEYDDPWSVLRSITKEMWDSTLEMLQRLKAPWRLFIVKDSPMQKRELEIWLSVCAQPSQPPVACTFLSINANPPLRFPTSLFPDIPPPPANPYTTPSSTPAAANTQSPDPSALISTPGGNQPNPATPTTASLPSEFDPSAKLIDVTDDTWSLTLPSPLTDPLLPLDICRPIASGYLLKRGGPRNEDGIIPAQLDVIHTGGSKANEDIVGEILSMYGGLGTLARVRGLVHPVRCGLPWHVAAARKANAGFNAMMRWSTR